MSSLDVGRPRQSGIAIGVPVLPLPNGLPAGVVGNGLGCDVGVPSTVCLG